MTKYFGKRFTVGRVCLPTIDGENDQFFAIKDTFYELVHECISNMAFKVNQELIKNIDYGKNREKYFKFTLSCESREIMEDAMTNE